MSADITAFSALHDVERTNLPVFDVALHIECVRLKVIPASAGELLRTQLGNDFGAYVLNDLGLELSAVVGVFGGEQKFKRIGKTLTPPATFCTLKRYTREANIPLKQNPSKLKPPRLEELMQHFGITPELVTRKCKKWFGGGDRAHDARYDTVATYLCMLVGEEKA